MTSHHKEKPIRRIYITQDSAPGQRCRKIAEEFQLPNGWEITDNPDESDVYFSCFSRRLLKSDFLQGRRCYNFHLGLLPKYRGSGTYSWVIINGEKETGITMHEIDAGIDTGRIIAVEKYPIGENDTANDVLDNGSKSVERMFKDWFIRLVLGDYIATTQTSERMPLHTRAMWEDARDLTRFFRAFCISGREGAYYINSKGEKIHLE